MRTLTHTIRTSRTKNSIVVIFIPLFMPYFEIKRCLCGVKYDTNIKNSILISRAWW